MKRLQGLLGAVALGVLLVLVGGGGSVWAGDTVYLKYNVHVQDQLDRGGNHVYKANYAGWIDPPPPFFVIPAGTAVTIGKARAGFSFTPKDDPKEVLFEFKAKHMGMSVEEYIEKITSPTPVALTGLSKVDRQGVREGKAKIGMSKEGVLTALGLPPTHKTPSLENNSWIYWKSRFATLVVEFDNGLVKSIRE